MSSKPIRHGPISSRLSLLDMAPFPLDMAPFPPPMKNGIYKAKDNYAQHGIACLRMYNIDQGKLVWRDVKRMVLEPDEITEYGLVEGDLPVNRVNSRELVGKACVIPAIETCVFESKNIRLRLAHGLEPKYVNYLLLLRGQAFFNKNAQQTVGMASISQDQLAAVPVPLAPANEQRRIVQKIEELFSKLDAGVAALERVKANLKRYRAAVLKAAVEGKLTAEWRAKHPDTEPASKLLERILKERRRKWEEAQLAKYAAAGKEPPKGWREKYREPFGPDTSEPEKLVKGWCYTGIEPLLSLNRAGMKTGPFGSLLKKHEHRAQGMPVYGIENIGRMRFIVGSKIHVDQEKANSLSDYDAQPGDVLVSRSGTVGEVCVVPHGMAEARISTNLVRITLAENGVLPTFLVLLITGSPLVLGQIHDLCSGSTRDFLNQTILRSIIFPLPPLDEQREIIAEVERRLSIVDEVEVHVEADLKRAARLRQSILKRAFARRLVPQDPNDEPATKLLERIRAEHSARNAAEKETGRNRRKAKTRR